MRPCLPRAKRLRQASLQPPLLLQQRPLHAVDLSLQQKNVKCKGWATKSSCCSCALTIRAILRKRKKGIDWNVVLWRFFLPRCSAALESEYHLPLRLVLAYCRQLTSIPYLLAIVLLWTREARLHRYGHIDAFCGSVGKSWWARECSKAQGSFCPVFLGWCNVATTYMAIFLTLPATTVRRFACVRSISTL